MTSTETGTIRILNNAQRSHSRLLDLASVTSSQIELPQGVAVTLGRLSGGRCGGPEMLSARQIEWSAAPGPWQQHVPRSGRLLQLDGSTAPVLRRGRRRAPLNKEHLYQLTVLEEIHMHAFAQAY